MKKTILSILQIVVTIVVLVYVLRKAGVAAMADALAHASLFWISIGILFYGIVEILATIRLQLLLRVQGIDVSWSRLLAIVMIGILFNQFMPGGIGGDVVKIFYLLKETPGKKPQALLAVLMDRLVGMVSLMAVAALLIGFRYNWLTQGTPPPNFSILNPMGLASWLRDIPATTQLVYLAIALFASAAIFVAFSFVVTGLNLVDKIPKRFPAHDKLVELAAAYHLYARAWKPSALAFVISFGIHLSFFGVYYAASEALNSGVRLLDLCGVLPVINTVASLPISVGGAGVREGLFQTFLNTLCGVSITAATVISLTGAAIVLFWGLVGGAIYLFYRPTEHAKISEMTHTVEEVEEKIVHPE